MRGCTMSLGIDSVPLLSASFSLSTLATEDESNMYLFPTRVGGIMVPHCHGARHTWANNYFVIPGSLIA